ncbi:N utilization substance protein B [Solemya pervernicosa gill symbiont]|uniref:Transcription antitermination protein NusB n=2 Tax=Gammaproteobacteria incertae sedis TaxID=118884 RepID=A0A1T2L1D3_9GAMM|nr:transcription antitermination factor NusB [Candidatus Reidiella endopervernicosa]OOZ38820.1 N utilization substance protein B [Solemya pervernicosa gill symbiont]QKQ27433.1 transcription antitermination factor NusB [Candidatus Reidiella endopervernicosa]
MSAGDSRKNSGTKARARARRIAVQALYQWHMTGQNIAAIESQFIVEQDFSRVDKEYFSDLLHGVPTTLDQIDEKLAPALHRGIEEVDPVERAILRLGTYELLKRIDIPYKVVINESVELAKTFGADQGHKFINGVLDKVAKTLRAAEVAAKKG